MATGAATHWQNQSTRRQLPECENERLGIPQNSKIKLFREGAQFVRGEVDLQNMACPRRHHALRRAEGKAQAHSCSRRHEPIGGIYKSLIAHKHLG